MVSKNCFQGFALLLILAAALLLPLSGMAAPKKDKLTEPSFEVKFLLDPNRVLGSDFLFTPEFLDLFHLPEDGYTSIDVLYLETADRAFISRGWVNRLRLKDGKKKIERTYKKRYPLSGTGPQDIHAALLQAEADGFSFGKDAYEAEIEWGYDQMTLSVSLEDSQKHEEYTSLGEFSTDEAVAFLKEAMPEEEAWGRSVLDQAQSLGPLRFLRIKGSWEDLKKVTAEIWTIPQEQDDNLRYIAELSFKTDDYETATDGKRRLTDFLDVQGFLLHEDALKTTEIYNSLIQYLSSEPAP